MDKFLAKNKLKESDPAFLKELQKIVESETPKDDEPDVTPETERNAEGVVRKDFKCFQLIEVKKKKADDDLYDTDDEERYHNRGREKNAKDQDSATQYSFKFKQDNSRDMKRIVIKVLDSKNFEEERKKAKLLAN